MSEAAIGREDLIQLRESVERWVEKDYPFTRRKAALASAAGYDPNAWRTYTELGWLGLSVPEAHGGAGLDDAALLCLMTATGRGLLMEPILSTCVLGAGLIAACGTPAQQAAHLPAIVSGDSRIALAHAEPQLGFARSPIAARARRDHAGWTLSGEKCAVLDGPGADTLLVTAIDPDDQLGLFLLPPDAAAVEWRPWRSVDGRHAADIKLAGAAAERLGARDAAAALDHTLDRATLAVCAEAVGVMDFLVDMYIALEESRAMVDITLGQMDADSSKRQAACSALKVQVCRAGRLVGAEAVQLHGGIGMTDDLKIGHGFKRLMQIEAMFGNTDFHLARYATVSDALDPPLSQTREQ